MFLPWFVVGRTQFIWYMLPAVPFMCLAVSTTLRRMSATLGRERSASCSEVLRIVAALLFLPAWTGGASPISGSERSAGSRTGRSE